MTKDEHVEKRADIDNAYREYALAWLMCMNAKCSKNLMDFLKQQQTMKPVGETVYPNEMAVAINFINNQEERNRRNNTNSRRNANKKSGNEETDDDADVKMTKAVQDLGETESTHNGNDNNVPKD